MEKLMMVIAGDSGRTGVVLDIRGRYIDTQYCSLELSIAREYLT
jgi:hypothetical protein